MLHFWNMRLFLFVCLFVYLPHSYFFCFVLLSVCFMLFLLTWLFVSLFPRLLTLYYFWVIQFYRFNLSCFFPPSLPPYLSILFYLFFPSFPSLLSFRLNSVISISISLCFPSYLFCRLSSSFHIVFSVAVPAHSVLNTVDYKWYVNNHSFRSHEQTPCNNQFS